MKHSQHPLRLLAASLLMCTLLTVPVLAAPTDGAPVAIHLPQDEAISASQAVASSQSPVSVTPDEADNAAFQVTYQDKTGSETQTTVSTQDPEEVLFAYINAQGDGLRVRQGPGTGYSILTTVTDGTLHPITGRTDGWCQIAWNGRTGYVSSQYVIEMTAQDIEDLNHKNDNSQIGTIAPPESFDGELAQRIVAYALQFEGYPYVYATAGPDTFDCSGFTSYVYKQFGYTLNRSSRDQLNNGTAITKAELQPSDLVLFSRNGAYVTHVGLYIGDGKFIHASTATTGVIISDLTSDYYTTHFFAARRIL